MRLSDSTNDFSDALFYIYWMVMHENMAKNEFLSSFPSDAENFQKKYFGEAQEYSPRWGGSMGIGRRPTDDKNEVIANAKFWE